MHVLNLCLQIGAARGDQMVRRGKGRNGVSVLSVVKAIVATGLAAFTIRDAP